ncbi:hypothetical protein HUA76_21515 [Myxococcus sp. CA056]|uniref:hypothetical protein n=1 Tax=Myxococcus sp. CA056 TaxID=2741740 RepID=UPI00157B5640|nr:hypothetical protein [Myxococcus sp. CA056]NTX13387.1 hypothetical protein [Myxococcus sp. CA056]
MSVLSPCPEKIRRRGGEVLGDEDFELVRCASCETQYLHDSETEALYLDPADLTVVWRNFGGLPPPCRGCGRLDWDFQVLPNPGDEAARQGPWSWALSSSSTTRRTRHPPVARSTPPRPPR